MSGAEPRASCSGLYRKLKIILVPHQYKLSLMLFIINNPNNFQTDLEIHGLHTRSRKINFSFQLQTSRVLKKELNILILKYITVCSATFQTLGMTRNNLKISYTGYLLNNSFYSAKEFLEFSRDN